MCRNIKTLFNFDPSATDKEIRDASLQFVRKLSGYNTPSMANESVFNAAIDEVFDAAKRLLTSLENQRATEGSRSRGVEGQSAIGRTFRQTGGDLRCPT